MRVLAWIVVLLGGVAIVGAVHGLIVGDHTGLPTDWGSGLIAVIGVLTIYPLFVFVAIRGRPPKWWKAIDEFADITKPRRPK